MEESDIQDTRVKVGAEDQSEAAEPTRSGSETDSPEELEQGRVQLIGLTPRLTTMDLRQAQEQIVELERSAAETKAAEAHRASRQGITPEQYKARQQTRAASANAPAESSVTPSRDIDTCTPSDLFPEPCLQ
jgi:hypothetical protein